MRSIMRNAEDLRQAMDVTESTADYTNQNLEMTTGSLQATLDKGEDGMNAEEIDVETKVAQVNDIILN